MDHQMIRSSFCWAFLFATKSASFIAGWIRNVVFVAVRCLPNVQVTPEYFALTGVSFRLNF